MRATSVRVWCVRTRGRQVRVSSSPNHRRSPNIECLNECLNEQDTTRSTSPITIPHITTYPEIERQFIAWVLQRGGCPGCPACMLTKERAMGGWATTPAVGCWGGGTELLEGSSCWNC